jgi:hypothetical protein
VTDRHVLVYVDLAGAPPEQGAAIRAKLAGGEPCSVVIPDALEARAGTHLAGNTVVQMDPGAHPAQGRVDRDDNEVLI